jgi:hypothetical protein
LCEACVESFLKRALFSCRHAIAVARLFYMSLEDVRWGGGGREMGRAYVLKARGELGPFSFNVRRFRGGSVVPRGLVHILHIG